MTRSISESISIVARPAIVFDVLIRPTCIRQWWFAKRVIIRPKVGGALAITWGENEDDPDYFALAEIRALKPNTQLKIEYLDSFAKTGGLPSEAQMTVSFDIHENAKGSTLSILQEGIPNNSEFDNYYKDCIKGWNEVANKIKEVVESI